jgi:hypothetical protein
MGTPDDTRTRFNLLKPHLKGRFRRLWAAAEALSLGRGGRTQVASITGICAPTIRRGIRELQAAKARHPAPAREPGARPVVVIGRPRIERKDPGIVPDLERMLDDEIAGDPMGEQRWVRCSLRKLRLRLAVEGHHACLQTIAQLLRRMGYSLRVNQKKRTESRYPDRDQQFRYIAEQKHAFLNAGLPVISVDTKKKEFIGEFKNNGRVWCREATEVNQYDFSTGAECLAVPYGVYDLAKNSGFVVVGTSHNTAEFAASSIARWWEQRGRIDHPRAGELLMLADGGGGNGNRSRAWKLNLQKMVSDRYGLKLTVCHYPPGCSKWNPVEYRLFSQISINWAGKPLKSLPLMLGYIRGTTTATGLHVEAALDDETYRKGQKVTRDEFSQLRLETHPDRAALNYTISPRT